MKTCNKCKVEKPLDAFTKNKSKKSGLDSRCRVCRKEHYLQNKKAISARDKEYYLQNKEALSAQKKEYYLKNKKALSAQKKEYRLQNKKAILAWNKEYNSRPETKSRLKEYYLQNKKAILAQKKEYYLKNKKAILARNKEYNSRPETKSRVNERERKRYNNDILFRLKRLLRVAVWKTFKGYTKPAATLELLYCTLEQFKNHIEKQFDARMTWDNQGAWHLDHIKPMAAFNLLNEDEKRYCNHWSNFQPMWGPENTSKQATWTEEDEANYIPPDLNKEFEL